MALAYVITEWNPLRFHCPSHHEGNFGLSRSPACWEKKQFVSVLQMTASDFIAFLPFWGSLAIALRIRHQSEIIPRTVQVSQMSQCYAGSHQPAPLHWPERGNRIVFQGHSTFHVRLKIVVVPDIYGRRPITSPHVQICERTEGDMVDVDVVAVKVHWRMDEDEGNLAAFALHSKKRGMQGSGNYDNPNSLQVAYIRIHISYSISLSLLK